MIESKGFYETLYYKQALRIGWSEFLNLFGQYKDVCAAPNRKSPDVIFGISF